MDAHLTDDVEKGLDWCWEKFQRMGEDTADLAFKRDMAHGTRSVAAGIRELRRLTAELTRLRSELRFGTFTLESFEALQAENERLRSAGGPDALNARRYEWLRDNVAMSESNTWLNATGLDRNDTRRVYRLEWHSQARGDLDEIIDAALSAVPPPPAGDKTP